ncbi:hemolysin III family protein [Micromonospora zamorensis]|uniref:Hemolysin III family protein n=1 Tax=Micromonospora zamorensis TaxID=709883 RepID=A0ABZ1PE67_9ACTN|nr:MULTISPECIES: hemolysin III family protein [Micromonospora]MBQ0978617.1 hemolysin III family protein [Micromonospora sp. M61]MBQ1036157.1 hemolysin III family protein [Micromonospora sp. C81]WSK45892.1 hemolysin III family protein [Micromonospora zamorensis]WTE85435.1 hemolysin III family protein [Micromonospora zamorensis]WTI20226.1 hemolysin III family protein [Micromonospora zamorensis]
MTTSAPLRLKPVDIGKPRMRGWLHTYAFFVAVVCGIVLCSIAATRPGWAPLVSCLIYSLTVCGLFGTSALYHRRVWSERGYQLMRRMDHSMIFVFIAGTYTPLCVMLLAPRPATVMLSLVWGGALAGVALKVVWPHAPRWVSAPLYLALGWVAVAMLPEILNGGGVTALVLLVVGGAIYSVGAVFYALRRPNPWPTVFGHHEFFHACTLLAALCHHIAIYFALFA